MNILISASDLAEAEIALNAGATWLDLKDVHAGPLGRASMDLQKSVLQLVADQVDVDPPVVLSVACGEVADCSNQIDVAHGFHFAKLGLSELSQFPEPQIWERKWKQWAAALPEGCSPVIVCYADYQAADGLSFSQALQWAIENGVENILVDTFNKREGGLFEAVSQWPSKESSSNLRSDCSVTTDHQNVLEIVKTANKEAAKNQIRIVWAGRLNFLQARELIEVGAEVIGFRSAVCQTDRGSMFCRLKIREALSLGIS